MKKNILIITLVVLSIFMSACTSKPFVSTADIMSYDMTGVDVSNLKTSKVCTDSDNKDVSVRHAAQIAGFNKVYAVDNETVMASHLFGPDTVESICTVIYGK